MVGEPVGKFSNLLQTAEWITALIPVGAICRPFLSSPFSSAMTIRIMVIS